jgi:hypothetical protein
MQISEIRGKDLGVLGMAAIWVKYNANKIALTICQGNL